MDELFAVALCPYREPLTLIYWQGFAPFGLISLDDQTVEPATGRMLTWRRPSGAVTSMI
jgi:hypothetical protein